MKICIFADIHGNVDALNQMLECEMDAAEIFIFAGDIFGYFYGQQDIIDRFMSMENLIAIRGNHEKYYLSENRIEHLIDKYGSSYKVTLTREQQEYVEKLPNKIELQIEGKKFGIFHGGPLDFCEQRLYPDSEKEIAQIVKEYKYDYLILGHTHYQLIHKSNNTIVINPGSLGQPRDGKGFSYCVLDTITDNVSYKTVDIKIADLLMLAKKNDPDAYVYKYLMKKYIQE